MKVLAISAHPDDETIGCGGTLLRHVANGDAVYWSILTKAFTPRWSEQVVKEKEREVESVTRGYGVKECFWSALQPTTLDHAAINDVIEPVRKAVEKVRPEIVYVVHHGDIHTDHAAVFNAVTIVLKPFHMRRLGVRRLLSFECLSSTDAAPPLPERIFQPNVYSDITPFIDRKLEILRLYASEAQSGAMPRTDSAIRALARFRGSTVGCEYAEAFMLIREIS